MRVAVAMLTVVGCSVATPSRAPDAHPTSTKRQNAPAVDPSHEVAITFDDLGASEGSAVPALSARILEQLTRFHAPVAVFVNCRHLRDEELGDWVAAGATIGNHTEAHESLDDAQAVGMSEEWWRGVQSCDERLTKVIGQRVHYFRYPYLRYGANLQRKREAAERLRSLGYEVAHVTAATSEWLIAEYYDVAIAKGDRALAQALASRYVEHMVRSLDSAERLAITKLGRPPKQITLVHVNQLAADHLGNVLSALRDRQWRFVSLADALGDPLYGLADGYVGGCGCSWLARIDPPLKPGDEYVFGDFEDDLRREFEQRVAVLRAR